jgi:hypothetical protein
MGPDAKTMTIRVERIHNGFLMSATFLTGGGYSTPLTYYPDGQALSETVAYMSQHSDALIRAVDKEHKRRTAKAEAEKQKENLKKKDSK